MIKILLVEDERTMLMLLTTLLRFEGFEVVTARGDASLEEMLGLIKTEQPSLILLDINLQRFNGLDLLSLLHQTETTAPIKVLMTSGSDYREHCLAAGADGFLLKPYMPEDLIQRIRALVDSPTHHFTN